MVCPHNVYASHPDVFANRDSVSGTIERLLRLLGAAELGILSESEMDTMTVTELLVTKSELNRQHDARQKREYERARLEAEVNQDKGKLRPSVMGS